MLKSCSATRENFSFFDKIFLAMKPFVNQGFCPKIDGGFLVTVIITCKDSCACADIFV